MHGGIFGFDNGFDNNNQKEGISVNLVARVTIAANDEMLWEDHSIDWNILMCVSKKS